MGSNCSSLVSDLFLFERDVIIFLSDNMQADVMEAFNTTSMYLDYLLNSYNLYFEQIVSQLPFY